MTTCGIYKEPEQHLVGTLTMEEIPCDNAFFQSSSLVLMANPFAATA